MSLKIELEKESFYPGELVKGVLFVHLTKPIKARKVQIRLDGRESTVISSGDDSWCDSKQIVLESINLWTTPGDGVLGPCDQIFPFQFHLPEEAPPTFGPRLKYSLPPESEAAGLSKTIPDQLSDKIIYEIRAKIDKIHALDPRVERAINVLQTSFETVPTKRVVTNLTAFSGKVRVEAIADKNVYTPGEQVKGIVRLTKDPVIQLKSVQIALKFEINIRARGRRDNYSQIIGIVQSSLIPFADRYEWPFNFKMPRDCPVSMQATLIDLRWVIDVEVKVPYRIKKHLAIPLYLATNES